MEKKLKPDWCKCGHCVEVPSHVQYCCIDSNEIKTKRERETCITMIKDFETLCLSEVVLDTAAVNLGITIDPRMSKDTRNEHYRKISYSQFINMIWKTRADEFAENLPCCVFAKAHEKFPSTEPGDDDERFQKNDQSKGRFVVICQKEPSGGARKDLNRLKALADKLKFSIHVIANKRSHEIFSGFQQQIKQVREQDTCFICVIMCHGCKVHMLKDCSNQSYSLTDLTQAAQLRKIQNVPKLFFVLSCRKDLIKLGKRRYEHIEDPGGINTLTCFSTVYGDGTWRDMDDGSDFIKFLCESIEKSDPKSEIMEVLTVLKRKMATTGVKKEDQISSTSTRLTKDLFLVSKATGQMESTEFARPGAFSMKKDSTGIFLIVADANCFHRDIHALRNVASLWGFKEKEIITISNKEIDGLGTYNFAKNSSSLLEIIKGYESKVQDGSCLICAIVSSENGEDKFVLNYGNKTYHVRDVTSVFDDLKNDIPRLFFVQKPTKDEAYLESLCDPITSHPFVHVFITYSAAGKHPEGKDISPFFELLQETVGEEKHDEYYDLYTILTKVRGKMAEKGHSVPWTQTQLTQLVRFPKPWEREDQEA